ncbi:ABC transporter family substrate-binding protein [Pseudonocardia lutea]|jgi:peptide/nickel transport system substrate-binding protein|uniref:ABC transporter family substrate-binding protein n=1 Tax=Pseudonocardia lutea TaxID=2172015 RepID=A0ABW1I5W4_9PSEU
MRRTRAAAAAAVATAATLVLAACGGGGGAGGSSGGVYGDCSTNPNTCNSVPADQLQQGGTVTLASEKNIDNWNVISSEGNVDWTGMAIKPMVTYAFYTSPDLKPTLNTDLLDSADLTNPTTIVYKIKPSAVWNDGTPVTADDFVMSWKWQNTRDCPACETAGNGGYDQVTAVTGSDDGKTVTVTLSKPYTDWQSLFNSAAPLYPAHLGAQQGDLNTPDGLAAAFDWFGKTVPNYSAGPFQVENWQDNVALTLVPNAQWYGATKPKLERLVIRVITDATQEPLALQNNEVQALFPQPQVDIVNQLNNIPNVSNAQAAGLSWEHFDFNLQNPFLADKALRQALYIAVNTQDVIAKTVGQFNPDIKPLQNKMFVPQQEGYQDNLTATGQGSGDVERAKKVLTDAGYTGVGTALVAPNGQAVPPLRMRYTVGNAVRQTECELFQQYAKQLGVNVEISTTDSLGTTTSTGDYDVIVFGWIMSPAPFGGAQQLWLSNSGSNYGKYVNPTTDQLINEAAASTDINDARAKLNQADKIMAEDAYVLPLYQKPTLAAVQNTLGNVRNNASLDGITYNTAEWGIRSGS